MRYGYSGMRNIEIVDHVGQVGSPEEEAALDSDVTRVRDILTSWGRKRSLRDPLAAMCEELDLSAPHIHCLLWLGIEKVLTMGEISRRLGITEKSCTGLVDRLEAAGHTKRERDQDDRRVVRVRLTDVGASLFEVMNAGVSAKFRLLLGVLDPSDRSALCNILEKLRDRLSSLAETAGEES
jgi:DNA-binding MarR family transcriptional regulator